MTGWSRRRGRPVPPAGRFPFRSSEPPCSSARTSHFFFVADHEAVGTADHPILVVPVPYSTPEAAFVNDEPRPEFRVIADQLWSVENNLSLANMDWADFTGSADDGVHQGFGATSMSLPVSSGPLTMTPQEEPDSAVRAEAGSASGGRNTRMVVVAGHVTVEPEQRESYLAASVIIVEQARGAPGCLDVAIMADLVDPGRVNIYERWESQAALEAFRRSGPAFEHAAEMLSVSMAEYDIAGVRPLFGESTE